jgi:hypothetical protein
MALARKAACLEPAASRRRNPNAAVDPLGRTLDGRSVQRALTARGRALDEEMPVTVEGCVRRALASLRPAKIDAAQKRLEAVARELALEVEQTTARRR